MWPLEIRLRPDRRSVEVDWDDGRTTRHSAGFLRAHAMDAGSVRARLDGEAAPVAPAEIREVRPVGSYAVNLAFADGHDRGIYPWRSLRELGELEAASAAAWPREG